jgi:hypothetical protein
MKYIILLIITLSSLAVFADESKPNHSLTDCKIILETLKNGDVWARSICVDSVTGEVVLQRIPKKLEGMGFGDDAKVKIL